MKDPRCARCLECVGQTFFSPPSQERGYVVQPGVSGFNSACVRLTVLISAVASVNCAHRMASPTAASSKQYSRSFAVVGCAPTDAPSLVLYLLDSRNTAVPPSTEHMRIEIWSVERVAGRTFNWPAKPLWGRAVRCTAASACDDPIEGQISFRAVTEKSVEGDLDFQYADRPRVRQAFKAGRPRRPITLCG